MAGNVDTGASEHRKVFRVAKPSQRNKRNSVLCSQNGGKTVRKYAI